MHLRPPGAAPTEPGIGALVGWAALTTALVLWPARWGEPLGNTLGEAPNHLWMFWRELARAPSNLPDGVPIPLMDPVHLPVYALGALGGPVAGWWGLAVFNVLLAGAGAAALASRFTGRGGALLAGVACASAPSLAGVLDFGITEAWPVGWFGLHLAALHRYAEEGRRRDAVAAGVFLGAIGLSGWYHALMGLVVDALWVPWLLWRTRRAGLVLQGLIGLGMTVPALVVYLERRALWAPRLRLPSPGPPPDRPNWLELPVFGADALTFITPTTIPVHPSKATYLGLVVLILAGLGLRRREGRWLWAPAGALLVLALGHWPSVGGAALGVPGPAQLLVRAAPALAGISHWHRMVGPTAVLLAAAAAVGAGPLLRRWPALVHLLCALVLAEGVAVGPTAWPRETFSVEAPASLSALVGEGGLIQLPFDNGRRNFSSEPARLYQRWQIGHGRAISENYEGVDALLDRSVLVAALDQACSVINTQPPYYQPAPQMRGVDPPGDGLRRAELQALRRWGYAWVVLHRSRCQTPVKAIHLLERMLGPRLDLPGGDAAWRLPDPG